MRRCIQRLVEDELIQKWKTGYRDKRYSGVLGRRKLEGRQGGGENWREDKREEMQRCILRIVKEEWKILKPNEISSRIKKGARKRMEPLLLAYGQILN